MVKHYNPSIGQRLQRIFNFKGGAIVDEVNTIIQPTIEIKPRPDFIRGNASTTTGTGTIITLPTDKDFYLTGFTMTYQKGATCDNTSFVFSINVDGSARSLIDIRTLTLTASNQALNFEFTHPIKIDRGSSLTHTASFTVGSMNRSVIIRGYFENVTASQT